MLILFTHWPCLVPSSGLYNTNTSLERHTIQTKLTMTFIDGNTEIRKYQNSVIKKGINISSLTTDLPGNTPDIGGNIRKYFLLIVLILLLRKV